MIYVYAESYLYSLEMGSVPAARVDAAVEHFIGELSLAQAALEDVEPGQGVHAGSFRTEPLHHLARLMPIVAMGKGYLSVCVVVSFVSEGTPASSRSWKCSCGLWGLKLTLVTVKVAYKTIAVRL